LPVSAAYKRVVIALLTAAYTCNAMDRGVIPIIGQSIKLDLHLTDTQLGLLSGTAFALLYAVGGIPLARLAERINRVNIITCALLVWSALSALCGAAASFPELLLIRVGVGVAEAGCTPPAHSLISDYFVRDIARLFGGGAGRRLRRAALGLACGMRGGRISRDRRCRSNQILDSRTAAAGRIGFACLFLRR